MKTLNGKHILVTRPKHQAKDLSDRLKKHGAVVTELPLISIGPPASWLDFDQAFSKIDNYTWLIFASVNAVQATIGRLKQGFPRNVKIAAIGQSTASALKNHGVGVDFYPTNFVAENFVSEFPGYPNLSSLAILWPKTNIGRTYISDKLREAGAYVNTVHCYSTSGPEDVLQATNILTDLLKNKGLEVVTLTSAETVKNLQHILLNLDSTAQKLFSSVLIATIGPETARKATELLGRADIQSREYTAAGLVQAIVQQYKD